MQWVLVTVLVTIGVGAALFARGRGKQKQLDAGAVSDEWIAQHRNELSLDPTNFE